jgi:hypothetical protein
MCFSEIQSYINTILLSLIAILKINNYRLSIPLFFLATKDLIQGLLYKYINNSKVNKILTKLSWIHICFQPFIVNLGMSNFSSSHSKFWNIILIISFLYGIFTISTLHDFNTDMSPCETTNTKADFCSKNTISYIGNYHVGYRFKRTKDELLFPLLYLILMFIPGLFTNSYILTISWGILVSLIYIVYENNGTGETAAIWCFLSIIFWLPVSLFEDNIKTLITKI